jgi:hypothetical protein
MSGAITIRAATAADVAAVRRLARLDDRLAPAGEAMLGFEDDQLRVAVGRLDGRVVADPFHLTDGLVDLVRTRAAQTRPAAPRAEAWA